MTNRPRSAADPVLIELDPAEAAPDVAQAPLIDDPAADELPPEGQAMQRAVGRLARPASPFVRLVWGAVLGLITLVLGLAAWDFALGLLARVPLLGWVALALLGVIGLGLLAGALREWSGYRRLRRLDGLRLQAQEALDRADLEAARAAAGALARLYGGIGAADPARDALDADMVLEGAEVRWLLPRDRLAQAEIEAAARQVALVTAMVPLALADVMAALFINLRMIRRIAMVYGGQAGFLGNWRLARSVAVHLLATGAVAVGDDLVGSLAGGGVMSKLSRRFGEGVMNGALTARVGLAAQEVCRPLPFRAGSRPSTSALLMRALKGVFQRG